jgi:glycosyltransferase involved in cell wall biosynthesis
MNTDVEGLKGTPASRRILIVGMHTSIHVARWLDMIFRPDSAILVFPVFEPHWNFVLPAEWRYISLSEVSTNLEPGRWVVRSSDIHTKRDTFIDALHGYRRWRHSFLGQMVIAAPERLRECILQFNPEVLHSMEVQLAGYLCLETARRMRSKFPPWILSNWGSDIALFRKLPEHELRIRAACQRIDYYLAECVRDHDVARDYGYRGPTLAVIPASGGSDIAALSGRVRMRPSKRRKILLKGYHNWSGRALLALSAVALASKHLVGYKIELSLISGVVPDWIEKMRAELGLDITAYHFLDDHLDAIDRLAESRAVVGIGISDGISTTLLEAMAVGALPIQSCTACANEWLEHGKSGLIVSPHDTLAIADAIIRAVSDDTLVDEAAKINLRTVESRWSSKINGARVWEIYDRAAVKQKQTIA